MSTPNSTWLAWLPLALLVFAGCQSELPTESRSSGTSGADVLTRTSPPNAVTPFQSPPTVRARRIFTGRDSFGVAVNIKGEGRIVSESEECLELEGMGRGGHLGRIEIEQTYCPGGGSAETSPFTYTGSNGQHLSGWTKDESSEPPSVEAAASHGEHERFEGQIAFTDGEIRAVKTDIALITRENGSTVWNGSIHLEIDGDRFSLEVDGWLLHHVNPRFIESEAMSRPAGSAR